MKRTILFLTLLLPACTTSQMALQKIDAHYVGQKADKFFVDNGPPSGDYRLENGGHMYSWTSGVSSIAVPGSSNCTGNSFGGSTVLNCTNNPGGSIDMRCDLQIITDQKKVIQAIRVRSDSIGAWETSRCNELFSK